MFSFMRQGKGFYRNMLLLALPMVLQNLITESLALADTFMVGLLGEAPLAGVTLANIPIFVEQLMIFGFQSGTSVLISQFFGKGDKASISRVLGVGSYAAGGITALFGVVMFFFPTQFMGLFGNDAGVVAIAARYGKIVAFSIFFGGLSEVYLGAHRSMGNVKLGLAVLSVSMVTNVALNYALIFGHFGLPALGVEGAAWATLIARVLQFGIAACHALGSRGFRVDWRAFFLPGRAMASKFIRHGTLVVMNETLWGLGTSLYPTIMGHMAGSQEILAAYAVAGNVEKISTVAVFAVGNTAAILIGQAVGAGQRERVLELGKVVDVTAVLTGAAAGLPGLALLYTVIRPYVFPLFQLSAQASDIATMMLTLTFVFLPVRSFNCTNIVGVLRGGGDIRASTAIDLATLWVAAIPLAALAGLVWQMGIFWVCLARQVEEAVKVVIGLWRLRSGKWVRDLTRPEV